MTGLGEPVIRRNGFLAIRLVWGDKTGSENRSLECWVEGSLSIMVLKNWCPALGCPHYFTLFTCTQ
jgi:hypothetical protein